MADPLAAASTPSLDPAKEIERIKKLWAQRDTRAGRHSQSRGAGAAAAAAAEAAPPPQHAAAAAFAAAAAPSANANLPSDPWLQSAQQRQQPSKDPATELARVKRMWAAEAAAAVQRPPPGMPLPEQHEGAAGRERWGAEEAAAAAPAPAAPAAHLQHSAQSGRSAASQEAAWSSSQAADGWGAGAAADASWGAVEKPGAGASTDMQGRQRYDDAKAPPAAAAAAHHDSSSNGTRYQSQDVRFSQDVRKQQPSAAPTDFLPPGMPLPDQRQAGAGVAGRERWGTEEAAAAPTSAAPAVHLQHSQSGRSAASQEAAWSSSQAAGSWGAGAAADASWGAVEKPGAGASTDMQGRQRYDDAKAPPAAAAAAAHHDSSSNGTRHQSQDVRFSQDVRATDFLQQADDADIFTSYHQRQHQQPSAQSAHNSQPWPAAEPAAAAFEAEPAAAAAAAGSKRQDQGAAAGPAPGAMRAAAMQLAAAVREQVDLDRKAADRRLQARMGAARKGTGGAGEAPLAAPAQADAAAAAADRDDEVLPVAGLPASDQPPGFAGMPAARKPAVFAAAAAELEMPPGFEPRAARIQAQLSTLAAQLYKGSSIASSTAGAAPQGLPLIPLTGRTSDPQLSYDTFSTSAPSTAAAAAAPQAMVVSKSNRGGQLRRYLFVAGAVCRECGAAGHEEEGCSTPYCRQCNLFGHADGRCRTACSACGWQHAGPLHEECRHERCAECQLWGHHAQHCPDTQCNRCQCWGHTRKLCPGYCRKCHTGGHTTEACNGAQQQQPQQQQKGMAATADDYGHQPTSHQQQQQQQPQKKRVPRVTGTQDVRCMQPPEDDAAEPYAAQQPVVARPAAAAVRPVAPAASQDVRFSQQQADSEAAGQHWHSADSSSWGPDYSAQPSSAAGSRRGAAAAAPAAPAGGIDEPAAFPARSSQASAAATPAAGREEDESAAPAFDAAATLHLGVRRGTGARAKARLVQPAPAAAPAAPAAFGDTTAAASTAAGAAPAAAPGAAGDAGDDADAEHAVGVPVDLEGWGSDSDDEYGAFLPSPRRKGKAAAASAPAAAPAAQGGASGPAGGYRSQQSSFGGPPTPTRGPSAGGAAPSSAALQQPAGPVSTSAIRQLLSSSSSGDVKWRCVVPSGDRLGPYTASELLGWLTGGGRAPKGVEAADARKVAADPGSLMVCGINAKDYSLQKLPGAKFHKPLSVLLPALSAGMTYSPVTRADLAKGYPSPGWNAPP